MEEPYNLLRESVLISLILKPVRIAIELDHSGAGHSAGLGLFHNHSGRPMKPYLSREREKGVLRLYEEHLNTRIILYEGSMRV